VLQKVTARPNEKTHTLVTLTLLGSLALGSIHCLERATMKKNFLRDGFSSKQWKPVNTAKWVKRLAGFLILLQFVWLMPLYGFDNAIFDNSVNDLVYQFNPGTNEVGDEIILAGISRHLTQFDFEFWGTNTINAFTFSGNVQTRIRFYLNDGLIADGNATPGTVFYDSDWFSGAVPTQRSTFVFTAGDDFPVGGLFLPSSHITWSVQFRGMNPTDSIGVDIYSPAIIGSDAPTYWTKTTIGWQLLTNIVPMDFAARMFAVTAIPPNISTQPQNQFVQVGSTVTFNVSATGTPTIQYQWRKDGNAIAGKTNTSLTINYSGLSDVGSYSVVVSNSYGSATSATATLKLLATRQMATNPHKSQQSSRPQNYLVRTAWWLSHTVGNRAGKRPTLFGSRICATLFVSICRRIGW